MTKTEALLRDLAYCIVQMRRTGDIRYSDGSYLDKIIKEAMALVPPRAPSSDVIDVNQFDPSDAWKSGRDAPFASHAENMSYGGEETGIEAGTERTE